jgi:hypothetical protein
MNYTWQETAQPVLSMTVTVTGIVESLGSRGLYCC